MDVPSAQESESLGQTERCVYAEPWGRQGTAHRMTSRTGCNAHGVVIR